MTLEKNLLVRSIDCSVFPKIQRLTYWTIDSPDESVQIPSKRKAQTSRQDMEMTVVQKEILLNDTLRNAESEKNISFVKKVLYFISGIKAADISKQTEKKFIVDTSIEENPFWSKVCNILAIVSMAASGFLFSFLNKYN